MATTTPNLGLVKPDYEDLADIAVLNDNSDTIDAAVKAVQDSVPQIITGITSITSPTANTVVNTPVVFSQSFSGKPKVFCTCETSDPRRILATPGSITASGFTIHSWREYAGNYNITWFAIL